MPADVEVRREEEREGGREGEREGGREEGREGVVLGGSVTAGGTSWGLDLMCVLQFWTTRSTSREFGILISFIYGFLDCFLYGLP